MRSTNMSINYYKSVVLPIMFSLITCSDKDAEIDTKESKMPLVLVPMIHDPSELRFEKGYCMIFSAGKSIHARYQEKDSGA